jgi:hypothetical protein
MNNCLHRTQDATLLFVRPNLRFCGLAKFPAQPCFCFCSPGAQTPPSIKTPAPHEGARKLARAQLRRHKTALRYNLLQRHPRPSPISAPTPAGITGQAQQGRCGGGGLPVMASGERHFSQGPSPGSQEGKRAGEVRFCTSGRALALARPTGLENHAMALRCFKNYLVLAFPDGAWPGPASPVKKNPLRLLFRWRGSPPGSSKINSPRGPLRVVISPKGTYGPKEPPSRGPCTCAKYIFCRP